MKLFKLVIFLLVVSFLGIFIFQNPEVFNAPLNFKLNLWVRPPIEWSLKVDEIILISSVIGFFVGIVVFLKPWLRARRTVSFERKEKESIKEELASHQRLSKRSQGSEEKETQTTDEGKKEETVVEPSTGKDLNVEIE